MTGKIERWSAGSESGVITGENGASVPFHSSAVLEYDLSSLRAGEFVSFDLEDGSCPRAANVCLLRQHHIAGLLANRPGTEQLRYMGFDQIASVRAYRFERVSPGEGMQTFVVTTDLALFRKHRVAIQEGPGLCFQVLAQELAGPDSIPRPPLQRALTDQNMLAHLASRPVPAGRPRRKMTSPRAPFQPLEEVPPPFRARQAEACPTSLVSR